MLLKKYIFFNPYFVSFFILFSFSFPLIEKRYNEENFFFFNGIKSTKNAAILIVEKRLLAVAPRAKFFSFLLR